MGRHGGSLPRGLFGPAGPEIEPPHNAPARRVDKATQIFKVFMRDREYITRMGGVRDIVRRLSSPRIPPAKVRRIAAQAKDALRGQAAMESDQGRVPGIQHGGVAEDSGFEAEAAQAAGQYPPRSFGIQHDPGRDRASCRTCPWHCTRRRHGQGDAPTEAASRQGRAGV
ncbi:hypothetical protein AA103196_1456 [Ameyamaea chiangmaiensis NBRC 103196]|nr:hypothetical protein AA103196_1456 [Ameyamaea chiangmaiensis NBRC 103196]